MRWEQIALLAALFFAATVGNKTLFYCLISIVGAARVALDISGYLATHAERLWFNPGPGREVGYLLVWVFFFVWTFVVTFGLSFILLHRLY